MRSKNQIEKGIPGFAAKVFPPPFFDGMSLYLGHEIFFM
jgi:hypothetical protein